MAVFKCRPDSLKKVLVEVYTFADELKGVRSLHFLIRDRVEDQVAVSFRIMVDPKQKDIVKSKTAYKLGTLLPADKFAIDPTVESELRKYVAWYPEKRIADFGKIKFNQFIDILKNMSATVIAIIENNYFALSERTELAHIQLIINDFHLHQYFEEKFASGVFLSFNYVNLQRLI